MGPARVTSADRNQALSKPCGQMISQGYDGDLLSAEHQCAPARIIKPLRPGR